MSPKSIAATASGLLVIALAVSGAAAADAPAKPKVTFADQVAPIFRSRCNSCHNGDKQKGGLNLETFGGTMQGSARGALAFIPLWLIVAAVNLWIGVSRGGYSVAEETPIFLLVFAVPAAAAALAWWKFG